jgi:hypothetical protein
LRGDARKPLAAVADHVFVFDLLRVFAPLREVLPKNLAKVFKNNGFAPYRET